MILGQLTKNAPLDLDHTDIVIYGVVAYVDDDDGVNVDVEIYVGHVGVGVEWIRSQSFSGSVTPDLDSPTSPLIRLIHIHLLWESRKEYQQNWTETLFS